MQIYSIFGQIEEVAANHMIDSGKAIKVTADMIPESALYNEDGVKAKFAIIIPDDRDVLVFKTVLLNLLA